MPITPKEWDDGKVDVSATVRTKILDFLDDENAYSATEVLRGLNLQDERIMHEEFRGIRGNMMHILRTMVKDGQLETKKIELSGGLNPRDIDYYRKPEST